MASINSLVGKTVRFLTHLDFSECVVLVAVVILVGVICMRGYGDKLNW